MVEKYNSLNLSEPSKIYLCRPDNSLICELNGVQETSVSYSEKLNNLHTLSFTVDKYVDGELSNGYDYLDVNMYVLVERVGYFRMSVPKKENDGYAETKEIEASSCDWEFTTKSISIEVNCGTKTSLEYLDENNIEKVGDGLELPKEYVSLYNKENPKLSLLDVLLEKIPNWSVGYIDPTLLTTKENDQTVLVKRSFSTDSSDLYSFLTQTVSQAYKCIFVFDILHRKINAYAVENLGCESGVWISYRNLAQSVTIEEQSQDSVYTRFKVNGGNDLGIESVNFGENYIEDLSYFMREPYVSQEFANKYSEWLTIREEKRKEYRDITLKYNQALTEQTEVDLRVPNDGCSTDWSTFTNKELKGLIKTYADSANLLKDISYSIEIDTGIPDEIASDICFTDDTALLSDQVNEWLDNWLNVAKSISENESAWTSITSRRDYYAYVQVMIPNIRIQLKNNYGKENIIYYEEIDLLDSWETQWDLFGLTELKNKLKSYQENAQALIKYAPEDPNAEENYKIFHEKWVKYDKLAKECQEAIDKRQAEYDAYTAILEECTEKRKEILKVVSKDSYFTKEENALLSQFYNESDYINENIITISTDTDEDIINIQEQLYQDALEEISKESQPQLSFSVDIDNLLVIPEFRGLCENFNVGNFLYLSVENNDDYFVKVRITEISRNPACPEDELKLEFSNMIKSKSSRNDFTTLLDSSITSAKNQIRSTVKSTIDSSAVTISDSIIQALAHSSVFNKTLSNVVYETVTSNKGVFNKVISESVNANEVIANSGMFEKVQASDGTFVDTLSVSINASRISVGTLSVDRLIFRSRADENGNYEKSVMYELNSAGTLEGTEITEKDREYYELNGKVLSVNSVAAEKIVARSITADQLAAEAITSLNGATKLNLDTGVFKVGISTSNPDGALYFNGEDLTISGIITALSGKIGPWTISETAIYRGNDSLGNEKSLSKDVYIGTAGISFGDKLVYDTETGELKISGQVVANSGKIASWNIGDTALYTGSDTLGASGNENVYIGTAGISFGDKLVYDTSSGTFTLGCWNVTNEALYRTSPEIENEKGIYLGTKGISFGNKLVYKDGSLVINGKIESTSGKIGSWNIAQTSLYQGDGNLGTSGNENIYLGDQGISFGDKLIYKTETGELNVTGVITALSGEIGPWTINDDAIYKGSDVLGSGGNENIYLGNNGASFSDRLVYSSEDGSLSVTGDINATTIKIQDKIVLYDSEANEIEVLKYMVAEQATVTISGGDSLTLNSVSTYVTGGLDVFGSMVVGSTGEGDLTVTGNINVGNSIYIPYEHSIYTQVKNASYIELIGCGEGVQCFSSNNDNVIHVGRFLELSGNRMAIKGNITAGVVDIYDLDETSARYIKAKNIYRTISLRVSGKADTDSNSGNYAGLYDEDKGWVIWLNNQDQVCIFKALYTHSQFIAAGSAIKLETGENLIGVLSSITRVANSTYSTSVFTKDRIWLNGSETTYVQTTTSSDIRLKDIVSDMEPYEQFYKNLSPIAYRYHEGLYDKKPVIHWGFSAQNAVESFKQSDIDWKDQEFVVLENGKLTSEERKYVRDNSLLKMNYQNMIALNTHMTQKNIKEIEELKGQLQLALAKIKDLESRI